MIDRLDGELRLLTKDVVFPPTPDIVARVGRRIGEPSSGARAPWMRSMALAIGLSMLAVATVLGLSWVLPGLRIVPVGSVPPASPLTPGADLRLGAPTTDAPFGVDGAGMPDSIFAAADGGVVSLVFGARDGLPRIEDSDIGLLIQRIEGDLETVMIEKLVEEVGASVIPVSVGSAPGFWIKGPPHLVRYLTPEGAVRAEMTRLVGDTLVWQGDDALYRMESALDLVDSLRLAESVRER
ncbi:MAG TPA: hypothetical protein VFP30_01545 [Candidatus Limnocylindria bacterium]|nr:hypothetical protein [Candidatus Limnocylindria bacterium]